MTHAPDRHAGTPAVGAGRGIGALWALSGSVRLTPQWSHNATAANLDAGDHFGPQRRDIDAAFVNPDCAYWDPGGVVTWSSPRCRSGARRDGALGRNDTHRRQIPWAAPVAHGLFVADQHGAPEPRPVNAAADVSRCRTSYFSPHRGKGRRKASDEG
jgi:hypothetical protein